MRFEIPPPLRSPRINAKKIRARSPIKTNNGPSPVFLLQTKKKKRFPSDRSGYTQKHVYASMETRKRSRVTEWSSIFPGIRPRFSSPREFVRREDVAARRAKWDWPRDLTLCKRTGQLSAVSPFFGFHAHCVHPSCCQHRARSFCVDYVQFRCNLQLHRLASLLWFLMLLLDRSLKW